MASQKTLEHYLRELRRIEEHREKWCEQNVRRHYKDLMKDLQEFLGVEYAKLAQDDKLTYEILHQKGQYARFIEEVGNRVDKISRTVGKDISDTVQLTYQKCFEGMVDAVTKSNDYSQLKVNLKGIRAVTPDQIKNAVRNTFLEDALEKNHKTAIYDIKQQIGVGLSQGDRMSTMAKRISDQLEKDYKKSVCIARTETHRIREAGFQDASMRMNELLGEANSDYVMVKTWKTMKDGAVRPQRMKGKKGSKVRVMGKGPDHVKMHGVTVLVDEAFDLGDGAKAMAPGQSGVAGHDINCRCVLVRDLMTKEEYAKKFGKVVKTEPVVESKTEPETDKAAIEKSKRLIQKRMKQNGQLSDVQYDEFIKISEKWSDDQIKVYDKFTSKFLKKNDYQHTKDGAAFWPGENKVKMNINDTYRNRRLGNNWMGNWQTKFHEEFHQIDGSLFGSSGYPPKITNKTRTKEFTNKFGDDILSLVKSVNGKKYKNFNAFLNDDAAIKDLSKYLLKTYNTPKKKAQITMFTDALGLMTEDKFSPHMLGFWGHSSNYNKSRSKQGAASETWATWGGITFSGESEMEKMMKELMPETWKLMEKWFAELVLPKT